MQKDFDSKTHSTLLIRLRDLDDKEAWNEFIDRYAPKIYGWCRKYNLQEADAADVTQDVLSRLVKAIRSFAYDRDRGSFRGWLKTITKNLIRDLAQSWTRPGRGSGDTQVLLDLQALQGPNALKNLASELEAEAERELLREAEERVKLRVLPRTWQAYQQSAVHLKPAAEVAKDLAISVADVYVAKSRVIKMIRQEIEKLNQDE